MSIQGYKQHRRAYEHSSNVLGTNDAHTVYLQRVDEPVFGWFGVGAVLVVDDDRPGRTITAEQTFWGLGGKVWTATEMRADGWLLYSLSNRYSGRAARRKP